MTNFVMRRLVMLLAMVPLLLLPAVAGAAGDQAPKIESFTLDNGLEVVVIPDRRAPVVTHMVWYKAGAADEPWGKSGIAHFLEHLMFKGTSNTPEREFSRAVAAIGGQENAFTSYDYTAYYQKVTPDALGRVMAYEADRMANLVLSDEQVLPERDVILEERRQRISNRPIARLSEAMNAALYQNHPYGIPVIGWEHEMAQLSREDALEFYQRFYTPNNAVLVVAGDVDARDVLALARDTYGKVERRAEAPPRVRPMEPEPDSPRRVSYSDVRVTSPSFYRIYLVPSYRLAEGKDAEALEILSNILGGASGSRLRKELVIDEQVVESASAGYMGGAYDHGEFSVRASLFAGGDPQAVEARIDGIINRILTDGVTAQEVEAAQESLIRSTMYERDSQTTMARLYGSVLTTGGTIEDIVQWPERIRSVTVEDVNAAARKWLEPRRSVTGLLLPREGS